MIEDLFFNIIKDSEINSHEISDECIHMEILVFNSKLATNCEHAAEVLFSLISSVCTYRPKLENVLLRKAIRPLFYLGITEASEVIKWVKWFYNEESTNPNTISKIHPSSRGMAWMRDVLVNKYELIYKSLCELQAACEIYDLLFALKIDVTNKRVLLKENTQGSEYSREFESYKELSTYLIEKLSEYIEFPERDSLSILVDEELFDKREAFKAIGWL